MRLVGFQQLFVDRDNIIDSRRKRILRSETIVDGDNLDLSQVGDRHTFDQRAGVGIEAAAVQIDEHAIAFRIGERRDDIGANSRHAGFLDLHGIKLARLGGVHLAPGIGARAPFGERLGRPRLL